MKYPEYINGIKQEQNSIKRFFIKLWYSDWFRVCFIIVGIWWQIPLLLYLSSKLNLSEKCMETVSIALYLGLLFLGMVFNNYSNLRRIGLNEYHRKLKTDK